MIRRRATLLAPLGLLAAPTIGRAQAGWRAQFREIRYGIISSENERDAIARLQGLAAYSERKLGVPMRVLSASM